MSFRIAPYELDDLHGIAEIEKECFEHPWSYDSFCMEYADKRKHYFVAKNEEGALMGYGGFAEVEDEAHIMNVAVRAPYRRTGVGSAIMGAMIEKAKELGLNAITLEVDDSNNGAKALYEKAGFRSVGLRPHYYGWDRPANIYWLYFNAEKGCG